MIRVTCFSLSLRYAFLRNDKLLPGRTLCFVAGDTGIPDTSDSMKLMSHYRDIGAVGYVGLEHSCVQEANLAAAYDIPLISYVSYL